MTPLLPFDTFTLTAVAAELREALKGARVQKVQQPSPYEVVLALYGRGGAHRLLLCVDPRLFRTHLTQVRRENPLHPPGFCQVARKYLEGARLDSVLLPRFDRVLHLTFDSGEFGRVLLAAELMGRNANLILAQGHEGAETVRGVLRPVAPGEARELRIGAPYADPPGYHDRVDPLTLDGPRDAFFHDMPAEAENLRPWLGATLSGIGRFAADEILARAGHRREDLPNALIGLMDDVRAEQFAPHHIADEQGNTVGVWPFVPASVPSGRAFARESVSVALDTLYATVAERSAEEGEHATLLKAITREIAFRERELKSARATLAEAGRADEYERLGNLLLANLTLVPRGESFVTVPDLYAAEPGQEAGIGLDPKKSPQENAQAYFDRARKARDAADYAEGRAADLEDERTQLDALRARLESGPELTNEDLAHLRAALEGIVGAERVGAPAGAAARPQKAKPAERPYAGHKVRSYDLDGYLLLVGENAEANDFLMTRASAPSDLWMHVRAGTGAHGVLKTNNKPDRVPDTVVRQAAAVVAARSGSVKHSGLVAVDVTERRYVRKPRKGKPGLALYDRARTYDVTPRLPRDKESSE
jgi:Predicted RNA-binding protein homologous to eukaryotic snRNP